MVVVSDSDDPADPNWFDADVHERSDRSTNSPVDLPSRGWFDDMPRVRLETSGDGGPDQDAVERARKEVSSAFDSEDADEGEAFVWGDDIDEDEDPLSDPAGRPPSQEPTEAGRRSGVEEPRDTVRQPEVEAQGTGAENPGAGTVERSSAGMATSSARGGDGGGDGSSRIGAEDAIDALARKTAAASRGDDDGAEESDDGSRRAAPTDGPTVPSRSGDGDSRGPRGAGSPPRENGGSTDGDGPEEPAESPGGFLAALKSLAGLD